MVEQIFKLSVGDEKAVEKVIFDENIHYLHMVFNLFGAIISGYIPSGRYTILTEIIFVISAAIIVILKAKTVFIIKDEANVNKFNFKKEFCGIGFIMFMVYWIISCVDAIAY